MLFFHLLTPASVCKIDSGELLEQFHSIWARHSRKLQLVTYCFWPLIIFK